MIAGVLLGPSLFGLLLPNLQHQIFPKGVPMSILYASSQVGLVLYMFLIGVEFDTNLIRSRLRSAVSVSLAGILTPLALGCVLALTLISQPNLFGHHVAIGEAMLFLGAAIAITAFPMLARIIFERGLAGTSLGTLALAAGSSDRGQWTSAQRRSRTRAPNHRQTTDPKPFADGGKNGPTERRSGNNGVIALQRIIFIFYSS